MSDRPIFEDRSVAKADYTVWCDGMPSMSGCGESFTPTRRMFREGRKKSGWLVTHGVDFDGTPDEPRTLLFFCPSCAVIVLSQMAEPEQKS